MTQKFYNDLTHSIVGAAIEVHEELGPGLLEGVYEKCMVHLLTYKGFKIMNQQRIPVRFKESFLDCDLRYDLLVEEYHRGNKSCRKNSSHIRGPVDDLSETSEESKGNNFKFQLLQYFL